MNYEKYCLAPVRVFDAGVLATVLFRALISRRRIYRVFEESESIRQAFLAGRVFTAMIEREVFLCRLVREQGEDGAHYNLQFLHANTLANRWLEQRLRNSGFCPPWGRRDIRLPSRAIEFDLEAPVGVVITKSDGKLPGKIRNFSVKGLLFDVQSSASANTQAIGQHLALRVLTSRGDLLEENFVKVVRVHEEVLGQEQFRRGLGVTFTQASAGSFASYRGLIAELYQALNQKVD